MAIARPILGLLAIILLAGGIVLQFLVILSGLSGSPENDIYFLQADTSSYTGGAVTPPPETRWTYLRLCGVSNGDNANCFPTVAALPFDPVRNFPGSSNIPAQFQNGKYWFYLSRFAWVFYLVALFFAAIAFLVSLTALCARLGAYFTGFTTFLAAFFQALTAALMTAWTVRARNAFQANNQAASLGVKAYGFTWAAFACWFLAALFFCIGGSVSSGSSSSAQKSSYFGRKRSTRSRGSFIESENGRRVIKEEYE